MNNATFVTFRSTSLRGRGRRGQPTRDISRTGFFVLVVRSSRDHGVPSDPRKPRDLRVVPRNNTFAPRACASASIVTATVQSLATKARRSRRSTMAGKRPRKFLVLPFQWVCWKEGSASFTGAGYRVDRRSRLGGRFRSQRRSRPLKRGKDPEGRWGVGGWRCRARS